VRYGQKYERAGHTLVFSHPVRSSSRSSRNFVASGSFPTWMNCTPTCDATVGQLRIFRMCESWYLVERELPLVEEICCPGNGIFRCIACLRNAMCSSATNTRTKRQRDLLAAPSVITRKIRFFTPRRPGLSPVFFMYSSKRVSSTSPNGV